jgi:hypothetical protein
MTNEHLYRQRLTHRLALAGARIIVLVLLGTHRFARLGRVACLTFTYQQGGM